MQGRGCSGGRATRRGDGVECKDVDNDLLYLPSVSNYDFSSHVCLSLYSKSEEK